MNGAKTVLLPVAQPWRELPQKASPSILKSAGTKAGLACAGNVASLQGSRGGFSSANSLVLIHVIYATASCFGFCLAVS